MTGLLARNRLIALGGAGALSFLLLPTASAQQAADNTVGVTALQRLIVGAGVDKVAIDTPQSVTVVDQEDLDREQPATVGEALEQVPGVNVSGSDRLLGQSINIRGIGGPETGGEEGRIIINIDGATKYFEQYRMGGLFTDPELFKRVEVLRGPASSTLYGPGALGGVVNFTTKDASDFLDEGETAALKLKSTYDSNTDGWLGSAILAWRPVDNFEFLAAGNYRKADAYEAGSGAVIPGSEIDAPSGLVKGTWRFGEMSEQTLRASYMHWTTSADDQYYNQTGIDDPATGGFGTVDREVTDKTAIISYENAASDNPWIDLRINASFSDIVNDQTNATVPSLNRVFGYRTYEFEAENTFDYTGDRFENYLTFGSQTAYQERTTLRSTAGTHPQGTDFQTGVFVQNEFIWDERLTLIGGLRFDYQKLEPTDIAGAEAKEHTAFSPKIAAHYRFNETFAVFGSIAHTERLPTIDEVFDSGALGLDLDKEKSNNFEGGFAVSLYNLAQPSDALEFKATGFYNRIEDLILDHGRSAFPRYSNTGRARIYGVELEAAYESDHLFASAAYTYTIGDDLTAGVPLGTVAPHEFSATLGGRLPQYDVSFGWTGRFVAEQDRVRGGRFDRQPTEAFHVHDLFVDWKPDEGRFRNLEASFRVDNVFNEDYREYLSGTPAKGRTFKITLAKKFGV
ncbi:TonB-dependent receptor domain-containing protein [Nitratireductor thuwali]|uniref:TonB-dependent heme receptor A n=1 Tax=Nitratireductor thuwali TaxID=2267699 RepID=A0ABY5MD33_9HYPH|nr:TonB-dependent heme receptor A [Nitratireductor thuwali]